MLHTQYALTQYLLVLIVKMCYDVVFFGTLCLVVVSFGACCPSTNEPEESTTDTLAITKDVLNIDETLVIVGGEYAHAFHAEDTELVPMGNPKIHPSCPEIHSCGAFDNLTRPFIMNGCGGYIGKHHVICSYKEDYSCKYLEGSGWKPFPLKNKPMLDRNRILSCLVLPEISGMLGIQVHSKTNIFFIQYGPDKEKPVFQGSFETDKLPYYACLARINDTYLIITGGVAHWTDRYNYDTKTYILKMDRLSPGTPPTRLEFVGFGKPLIKPRKEHTCGRMLYRKGRYMNMVVGGEIKRRLYSNSVEISDASNNGDWTEPAHLQLPLKISQATMIDIHPRGVLLIGGIPESYYNIYHLPCLQADKPYCKWYQRQETLRMQRRGHHFAFMLKDPTVKCAYCGMDRSPQPPPGLNRNESAGKP